MQMPDFVELILDFIANYELIWALLVGVILALTSAHPKELNLSHASILVVYPGLFLLFRAFGILPSNSAAWVATFFSVVLGGCIYLGITFDRSKRTACRSFNRFENAEQPRVRLSSYSDIEESQEISGKGQNPNQKVRLDPEDHL